MSYKKIPYFMDSQKMQEKQDAGNVMDGRVAMLGIPKAEFTPSVNLAVSALLEKVDMLSRELGQTKEHLNEIEQLVDVDCLAPVPNRRAFMRRLTWAISMFKRYGHATSVIFFDLNGFKEINDVYGHAAGDAAIRHAAELFTMTTRQTDFVARLGGDEFGVIMYHADYDGAYKRAQKLAQRISDNPLIWNNREIHMDTALGVYQVKKDDTAEMAVAAADMAMYADKRGLKKLRGRVTNFSV